MLVKQYTTAGGRAPVEEFILSLPPGTVAEIQHAIAMLAEGMLLSMPLSRPMTSLHPGLHELRFRDGAGEVRVLYLVKKGDAIFLLHGFRKKTRETPKREIALALKRIQELNR